MKKVLALAIALTFVMSAAAFCGQNASHKVAVHVMIHASRSCTKSFPSITSCSNIVFTYTLCGDIDAFPVFYDLSQVTGVEFAIIWPEGDWGTGVWTGCTDLAIGSPVHSGDAFAGTWFTCKVAPIVLPGWEWLWGGTPGIICLGPNPANGNIGTADCADPKQADVPILSSCAGVCGLVGDDPCRPTAVEPTTWGNIKSMFK